MNGWMCECECECRLSANIIHSYHIHTNEICACVKDYYHYHFIHVINFGILLFGAPLKATNEIANVSISHKSDLGFLGRLVGRLACVRMRTREFSVHYCSLLQLLFLLFKRHSVGLLCVCVPWCVLCVNVCIFHVCVPCTINSALFLLWIDGGLHFSILTILTTQSVSRSA